MKLAQAKKIAVEICTQLEPYCKKINIAGSVKRGCAEVGDIEICAVFNVKDLNKVKEIINSFGWVRIGKLNGRYMQIALNTGIDLDLFMPQLHDYYRIYAIRVGSADFSAKILAAGWARLGWCGVEDKGLRRIEDCKKEKDKWVLVNAYGEKPPVWESEEEFFKWLNIDYIEPKNRK